MHEYRTRIRLSHTDAAAVVFFPRQLELVHEAFEELMRSVGWSLESLLRGGQWLLPVVRVEADYLHPLRLGDELRITSGLERLGDSSFTLRHELDCAGRITGRILTTHTLLDAADKRPRSLPPTLREALAGL
jgi:YbgC/YbaW family acyl-CoA thioester hydrolase